MVKSFNFGFQRSFILANKKNYQKFRCIGTLRKALKYYTKSFGIKIINKNEPIIQVNSAIDIVASILKEQLNEMKRIKQKQNNYQ